MKKKTDLATFRVDPEVWSTFKAKCLQNGKNASQVLTDYLVSYIEENTTSTALEQLEEKLTEISTELALFKEGSDSTPEPRRISGKGLTQAQICKLFGLQRNNLARDARKADLPVEEYLSRKTKTIFDQKTKRYYV